MFPLIGTTANASLPYQDEAGQQNGFERDERPQKGERRRIKVPSPGQGVPANPYGKKHQMNAHELQASCESCDSVSQALRRATLIKKVLFVLGDQFNMLSD